MKSAFPSLSQKENMDVNLDGSSLVTQSGEKGIEIMFFFLKRKLCINMDGNGFIRFYKKTNGKICHVISKVYNSLANLFSYLLLLIYSEVYTLDDIYMTL